jgi:hypothetical protein
MRFYRLTSDKTHDEIEEILSNLSVVEFEYIHLIYKSFDCIEYNDQHGYCGMYAILDDKIKSTLEKMYSNLSIKYKFEDLTKSALWGDFIETKYTDYIGDYIPDLISIFIESYYHEHITVDIILDKINERGINSLTSDDFNILDGFT